MRRVLIENCACACQESNVDIGQLSCALEWGQGQDGSSQVRTPSPLLTTSIRMGTLPQWLVTGIALR